MDYRSYRLNRKGGSFKKPKLLHSVRILSKRYYYYYLVY